MLSVFATMAAVAALATDAELEWRLPAPNLIARSPGSASVHPLLPPLPPLPPAPPAPPPPAPPPPYRTGYYTISGAGNASANGNFYATESRDSWVAASGMQLFLFEGRWYIGKVGSGPVLYQGACPSAMPPLNWTTYNWKGAVSPPPMPRLAASAATPTSSCGAPPCPGYTLTRAGSADANGCYTQSDKTGSSFKHNSSGSLELYRRTQGEWVIGKPGGADLYVSNCASATEPPACTSREDGLMCGWHLVGAGSAPGPTFSASVAFPLGYCAPGPPPPPTPHPRCATPECDRLWGPAGCPDLNGIAPDLVRPPMMQGTSPRAGARVRTVAPGFESTQVYHPLYLPTEWSNSSAQRFPIIVEYMGNGPFNDGHGDISTGRPEDSNLGWGMANPAGSQYIWISMPFVSADLGNRTEVSTYWWGCPSSDASRSCDGAFNITPTIQYLHAALQQAVSTYHGDPANVVITGWSRGAIATGAIGLYNDATSKLFKAFVPYSHLDGDCGWVDMGQPALGERWTRLGGRPMLYLGECAVATEDGPNWLRKIGQYGKHATSGMEFMTTGFANHNDAWVLRNSSARTYLRQWLTKVFKEPPPPPPPPFSRVAL